VLMRSKLIWSYALCLALLIFSYLLYQDNVRRLLEARHWIEHTETVLEKLEYTLSLFKDIETGQRGFLLTGDPHFLEPYDQAKGRLFSVQNQLRNLTIDNPHEQKRLDSAEDLEAANLAYSEQAIERRKTKGMQAAIDLTATAQGKQLMDKLREVIRDAENEERDLLEKRLLEADRLLAVVSNISSAGMAVAAIFIAGMAFALITALGKSVRNLQSSLELIGKGHLDERILITSTDEFGQLGTAFNDMTDKLKISTEASTNQSWLNSNLGGLTQALQGERNTQTAAQKILTEMAGALGSRHGMLYLLNSVDGHKQLTLLASYAHHNRKSLANIFELGQGLVGQCALEKERIVVGNVPDDYVRISSGVGDSSPVSLAVVPIIFENEVKAVIEQASFQPFTEVQLLYLDQSADNLGVILNSIETAQQTEKLLAQEQMMTEELQSQQEELTEKNVKLESLFGSLQASEEELKQQQEELQQSNEELEERARLQARQNYELEAKNHELEELRSSMQDKAQELSRTSRYKSEFLANMSHELRTPLNSLLILSKILSENSDGNLTDQQVNFAETIHSAGSDLLVLIDDVLDISKIEAGAMSVDTADELVQNLCLGVVANCKALAKDKNLQLGCEFDPHLPRFIKTDGRRLQQILRNLLSNAIKFTEQGSVILKVSAIDHGWSRTNDVLNNAESVLSFAVVDTGIGIAADKQKIIFEAFRQADGTTARRFGGTGLGLAISREIARLLGGEIQLESDLNKGSTFSLYLPCQYAGINASGPIKQHTDLHVAGKLPPSDLGHGDDSHDYQAGDDRDAIQSGDRVLLILEQDSEFARQLADLSRARDFKVLLASQGKTALALVHRFKPDAITMDVGLPDRDGWTFLDRLKRDSATRHIPVHIISAEQRNQQARRLGVIGFLNKPASKEELTDIISRLNSFVSQEQRRLLIVEDNGDERKNLEALIEGQDVCITAVGNGEQALQLLKEQNFDCLVLDLGLPDMTGFELIQTIHEDLGLRELPIIVHTARSLSQQEETALRRSTEAIIVKGSQSNERLLDETTLFLHRVETSLPEQKRKLLERLRLKDPVLSGRKILIVDDDVRHIFAVTSMLEQYDVNVLYAETGKAALAVLGKDPGIDLVLMDVMMPEMDGLEATRLIRRLHSYQNLPIIALTAKAMKGDREECITAGASDYISKPVDSDQLLSLMRVWLY
jgi:CheY-like chemotaxis protein/CHASE3 domain sensor protein